MGKPQNTLDDLWMLSKGVAVLNYTLTTMFLLYILSFEQEVTENEKAGIVIIIFTVNVVLAYSCRQVQKNIDCESISEDDEIKDEPIIDSSSNFKTEVGEMNTFQSLKFLSPLKSYVRSFSFPQQSRGGFCYHCNRPISSRNRFAFESQLLLKTDPNISQSTNSDGIYCKDSGNIPLLLHNSVKDLGDIIERVKLLNDVYTETDEGVEDTKQNYKTTFQKINSNVEFTENDEYHESKLQSASGMQKVTDSSENACSFQPHQSNEDLDVLVKLIRKRKIDSSKRFPVCVGVNQSLSEIIRSYNRIFSEDNDQEPFSKSCIIDTDKAEPLLVNIPSDSSEFFSAASALSERNMDKKISLEFNKTPETQTVTPKASLKSPLLRIPMKLHMLTIPARQYVQENTKKRRVAITSKKEPTISKHSLKISKIALTSKSLPIILRNEPIGTRKTSMISRNEQRNSGKVPISENLAHDLLISKFEMLDMLNIADVFHYFVEFYGLNPDHNICNDNQ